MPTYPLTTDWSDPIPVAKGDLVQNKAAFEIEVCAVTPPDSADAILIPLLAALPIESATTTSPCPLDRIVGSRPDRGQGAFDGDIAARPFPLPNNGLEGGLNND